MLYRVVTIVQMCFEFVCYFFSCIVVVLFGSFFLYSAVSPETKRMLGPVADARFVWMPAVSALFAAAVVLADPKPVSRTPLRGQPLGPLQQGANKGGFS